MSPYTKHTVEAYHCECLRCGNQWWADAIPKHCSKCKTSLWNTPRVYAPRKRKRNKRAMRNSRYRKAQRAKARADRKILGHEK